MFKSRAITFILITLMIDAIGIGIVFPIMPDLMERVGAGDTGQGAFWGGLLMAAYAGRCSCADLSWVAFRMRLAAGRS